MSSPPAARHEGGGWEGVGWDTAALKALPDRARRARHPLGEFVAIVDVRRASITHYNSSSGWQWNDYDFDLGGTFPVKAEVFLSKVNMWDSDVAAEAFISEVCAGSGPVLCTVYENDEGHVWIDRVSGVSRITMTLKTYGPIRATAMLLVHVYDK